MAFIFFFYTVHSAMKARRRGPADFSNLAPYIIDLFVQRRDARGETIKRRKIEKKEKRKKEKKKI